MLKDVHIIHCYSVASENAMSVNVCCINPVFVPAQQSMEWYPSLFSQIQKTNLQPETGTIMDHVLSVNNSWCTCFCQQFLVIGTCTKDPKVCLEKVGKCAKNVWEMYFQTRVVDAMCFLEMRDRPFHGHWIHWIRLSGSPTFGSSDGQAPVWMIHSSSDPKKKKHCQNKELCAAGGKKNYMSLTAMDIECWIRHHFQVQDGV